MKVPTEKTTKFRNNAHKTKRLMNRTQYIHFTQVVPNECVCVCVGEQDRGSAETHVNRIPFWILVVDTEYFRRRTTAWGWSEPKEGKK